MKRTHAEYTDRAKFARPSAHGVLGPALQSMMFYSLIIGRRPGATDATESFANLGASLPPKRQFHRIHDFVIALLQAPSRWKIQGKASNQACQECMK